MRLAPDIADEQVIERRSAWLGPIVRQPAPLPGQREKPFSERFLEDVVVRECVPGTPEHAWLLDALARHPPDSDFGRPLHRAAPGAVWVRLASAEECRAWGGESFATDILIESYV